MTVTLLISRIDGLQKLSVQHTSVSWRLVLPVTVKSASTVVFPLRVVTPVTSNAHDTSISTTSVSHCTFKLFPISTSPLVSMVAALM